MTIVETMWSLGGIARWSELRRTHSQHALEQSLQSGSILRTKRRGLYCLPERLKQGKVRAVGGVISHISAAEVWELGVLEPPRTLHITVRRSRHNVDKPDNLEVHYADLAPDQIQGEVTSVLRTVIDGGITGFEPQFRARRDGRWIATVDLGDAKARLLLEADSFFWHGQRAALERDARRYNELWRLAISYCASPGNILSANPIGCCRSCVTC